MAVGNWQSADEAATEIQRLMPTNVVSHVLQAFTYFERGENEAGEALLAVLNNSTESGLRWNSWVAPLMTLIYRITLDPKHLEIATHLAERMRNTSKSTILGGDDGFSASRLLMIAAGDSSNVTDAPTPEFIDDTLLVLPGMCSHRLRGLLDASRNDFDSAATEFSGARSFLKDAGFKPELAWSCSEHSELLLKRDAPGDREKATELQDESIAIAQELGMTPLLERVLAQREILKA